MTLHRNLQAFLSQPTCIVGIGNTLRSDDAAGVLVVEGLRSKLPLGGHVDVLNVEDVLENHVFRLADHAANHILLVDAVDAGRDAEAGALFFGDIDQIEAGGVLLSTHKLALSLSTKILRNHGKQVFLLGINVSNTDFGNTLSPAVSESIAALIELLQDLTHKE